MGLRVIFMGTPGFAVPTLDILVNAGYEIVGVITAADKFGGRGRKELIQSDVKKYAVSKGLNVMQPTNLKSPKFNQKLKELKADVQIVVAFRMLPEMVWNMPPHGTYNLHGSLLPKYRGAAPINWAVMNGDSKTGVTSFKLKHEIDTGSLYMQKELPIYEFDTAGDVHDRMRWIAADVVLKTVQAIEKSTIKLSPQNETQVTHAPKLNKENTAIDLHNSAKEIYDHIRGLSPFPTAWLKIDSKHTKVYKASYTASQHSETVGTIKTDNKSYLSIVAKDGYIKLLEIQMSGKKRMTIKQFLNGYQLKELKVL